MIFHYSIIPKKIKQIKARITIDYLSDYFFYLENFNELNKIQTIRKFFKYYEKNKSLFHINFENSDSVINSKVKLIKKEKSLRKDIKKIDFFKF